MVVLADVMSTLVHDPIFDTVPAQLGTDVQTLFRTLDPEVWFSFERGEIDERTYFATCFRDRRVVDGDGFRGALRRGYAWLPGVESLLGELQRAGVEVHALSNYPVWYRLIEAELGLSRYLRWSFVSCETGVRKPDPEAWLGAARTLGREPAECFFVDDRQSNVDGAVAVGMAAARFTSADDLRVALVEGGVL